MYYICTCTLAYPAHRLTFADLCQAPSLEKLGGAPVEIPMFFGCLAFGNLYVSLDWFTGNFSPDTSIFHGKIMVSR